MKQAEAERRILALWDCWVREEKISNPKAMDALAFHGDLRSRDDPALDFQCRGDKWQYVQSWLRRAKKFA